MADLSVIADKINMLYQLAGKDFVLLEGFDPLFAKDLEQFIIGQTLTMYHGKPAVGRHIYRQWLDKLRTQGFDYAINFNE